MENSNGGMIGSLDLKHVREGRSDWQLGLGKIWKESGEEELGLRRKLGSIGLVKFERERRREREFLLAELEMDGEI